jgi:hypothetical protein
MHLREQGYEDPWLFVEAKTGPGAKKFQKLLRHYITSSSSSSTNFVGLRPIYHQVKWHAFTTESKTKRCESFIGMQNEANI